MSLPGFTAEVSLYQTSKAFRMVAVGAIPSAGVVPAAPCCEQCDTSSACRRCEQCLDVSTPARCAPACRACYNCWHWCFPCGDFL
jgi:hypothetical protein